MEECRKVCQIGVDEISLISVFDSLSLECIQRLGDFGIGIILSPMMIKGEKVGQGQQFGEQ